MHYRLYSRRKKTFLKENGYNTHGRFSDKLLLVLAVIRQTAGNRQYGGNITVKVQKILTERKETFILNQAPVGVFSSKDNHGDE